MFNRGQYEVAKRIAEIEAALPFAILGFDTDNVGEFLNWHLVNYFASAAARFASPAREPTAKTITRASSRRIGPTVRQLVGYERLEDPRAAELLNEFCD